MKASSFFLLWVINEVWSTDHHLDAEEAVIEITSVNFDYLIRDDSRPLLMLLYSPTCPHCQALKPVWDAVCEIAEDRQLFRVGELDCVSQSHVCDRLGEAKVPSVYIFFDNGNKMLKYTGGKDADELSKFALGGFKAHVGEAVEVPSQGTAKAFSIRSLTKAVASEIVTVMRFSPIGCCALLLTGFIFGIMFDAFVLRVVMDDEEENQPDREDSDEGKENASNEKDGAVCPETKKTR